MARYRFSSEVDEENESIVVAPMVRIWRVEQMLPVSRKVVKTSYVHTCDGPTSIAQRLYRADHFTRAHALGLTEISPKDCGCQNCMFITNDRD